VTPRFIHRRPGTRVIMTNRSSSGSSGPMASMMVGTGMATNIVARTSALLMPLYLQCCWESSRNRMIHTSLDEQTSCASEALPYYCTIQINSAGGVTCDTTAGITVVTVTIRRRDRRIDTRARTNKAKLSDTENKAGSTISLLPLLFLVQCFLQCTYE
jgi:hypothetical protein